MPHAAATPAAAAAESATVATATSTSSSSPRSIDVEAVRRRERGQDAASSGEVVEELLSENERLRLIIQDMSEEVSFICL